MSTGFQSSIQTLNRLHEEDQQTIAKLKDDRDALASQLQTLKTIFSISELESIKARAEAEKVSAEVWLKDIIVTALNKDVKAVFLDKRAYDALAKLAKSRNIDMDTLMTRSGVTDFILNALQHGRL